MNEQGAGRRRTDVDESDDDGLGVQSRLVKDALDELVDLYSKQATHIKTAKADSHSASSASKQHTFCTSGVGTVLIFCSCLKTVKPKVRGAAGTITL